MIDTHTHILPGLDDGATDFKESLAMAEIAVADGISHMFATPHHHGYTILSNEAVGERVAQLQQKLDEANIPLTLLPGHEIRMHDDMLQDWDNGTARPLGDSRYVLAEPLFRKYTYLTDEMYDTFFEQGYIPIMAHPERIRPLQEDLSLIEPFLAHGGLTQVTAGSLTGEYGQRAYDVALEMLRRGMVHVLASDAHHSHRRMPVLSKGRDVAATVVGLEQANAMVTQTPWAVVNDLPLVVTPPPPVYV
ncbi:MAG: CpsB/CapC family capsule biosynthesis tyrosine phosphatase [Chloroflexota bacterium]